MPAENPLSEGGVHEETKHGSPSTTNGRVSVRDCGTDGGGARESGMTFGAEAVPDGGSEGTTPSSEGATIATRSCSKITEHGKMHGKSRKRVSAMKQSSLLSQPRGGRCLLPCQNQQRAGRQL